MTQSSTDQRVKNRHTRVAIIGTGFSGLGMAIRLKQEGEEDFLVFERAEDVGGTWRDHTYPGCACDVESLLYSYTFAPYPKWSRNYSRQPEIKAYLQGCAERFGVLPQVLFKHEVLSAAWDEDEQRWSLETNRGRYTAEVVVSGSGPLQEPMIPKIEGLATFAGKTFHSFHWDHEHDLRGRRVAVVGTGASAIQFIPEIQKEVGHMTVFQRTAPWVVPRNDKEATELQHLLLSSAPALGKAWRSVKHNLGEAFGYSLRHPGVVLPVFERLILASLDKEIADPELRRKVTPDYRLGCKRVLTSSDYYKALAADNCELVTDKIIACRPDGIVTADGTFHAVDTIIFGTGYHATDPAWAHKVRGRGGKTLAETWQGSPQAHLGIIPTGFPNFFAVLGPNTGLGSNSVVPMIEAQIEFILKALEYMDDHLVVAVEPRPEAQAEFIADVDRHSVGTVWTAGGCSSWYIDKTGRNCSIWPQSIGAYQKRVAQFEAAEFILSRREPRDKAVA